MKQKFCLLLLLILFSTKIYSDTPQSTAPHPIAQEMFRAGAISCAHTAHQIADLVSQQNPITLLQINNKNPDKNLVDATIITQREDEQVLFNFTMAPNQSNGCGASLRGLLFTPQSCVKSAKTFYPSQEVIQINQKGVLFIRLKENSQAMFFPFNTGCIVLTDELIG